MTLRPREQILLLVAAALVVLVGFYYLLYLPRITELQRLAGEIQRATAEQQRLSALVASRPEVEREFNEVRARVAELEAKLPPAREVPALLVQLEQTVRQSRARITLIRPGPLAAPPPPPGQRPGGQRPQEPQAPAYQQFSVELGARGDFEALVDFLQRLQNFPRLLVLSEVRMSPTSQPQAGRTPLLQLSVRATTYVLPEAEARP
ncbi:MAG: type 4a pilus biogenesis protein PilO [Armatimonadota bacterium]|nr:type 4a pilus biogenesis protein PilO [Armatimonadota bacterium]MDR7440200.1 type 4a pilus biogenesis protein PilO [Armatimonadota bacterium]MDR7562597.1 type 4a pilus biogenesis protein PilO [Armatimonadota bacterium]MDR7567840.1 type 4a pilus biogenesis protein PilO [Armatimonadota bacterium]MDR7602485.1 type 4a pilus biogenesis protein PilO [Armatimonadota bacterium]